MNRINCGIIGDGEEAFRHAHTISLSPYFSLVSIAPGDLKKGEELRKNHAIEFLDNDSQYLLERDEIDSVVITLPKEEHYKEALFALSYSKIVILDSPVASSSSEVEALLTEVENGAFIFNCNPYLYLPLEIGKGRHKYSIVFSSLRLEKDETARIALEEAVSLFSTPLSFVMDGNRIILTHENADGEILLEREGDDKGLSLYVDGICLLFEKQFYASLDNFYSYLYKTIEKGGETERNLGISLLASRITEKLIS